MDNVTPTPGPAPAPSRRRAKGTSVHYARIVEASPSGLMQINADGRTALVNRAIESMFGYDRSEVIGKPIELLIPERLRDGHKALRERFMSEATPRSMGDRGDLLGRRKDGSEFPIEIGLSPMAVGGEVFVIAAMRDTSSGHQALLDLERQRQELERSNADLEEFAHAASHDLKGPLRGLIHLAEWIAEDVAETASPRTLENCELLRGRAARMQALLDGLLAYARVGRVSAPIETFDSARMIQDVVASLVLPGGFSVELAGEMPTITTERVPLERVMRNLIENAVKHHDRQVGRVLVSINRDGGRIRVSVSDDGPGIAPRYHKRIFQMFQTLTPRDDVEASGIGLAIVKKKVEMHGGHVSVESEPPERGCRFVFTWPEMKAP